ncbi:hypothetical protein J6590_040777 [Homalodisca vitripennis]|nr:hypothetical protein J6590_040777 [Homalodisca vitripennis]
MSRRRTHATHGVQHLHNAPPDSRIVLMYAALRETVDCTVECRMRGDKNGPDTQSPSRSHTRFWDAHMVLSTNMFRGA